MKSLIQSAIILTLTVLISLTATANAPLDALLTKIDADIAAKRLSSPAGNNAIEKIWQFKAAAPYDQRVNSRAHDVGEIYVALANSSIAGKKYSQAQLHLDKAWMVSHLTPGLESSQDALDKVYKSDGNTRVAQKAKEPAKPVAKASNSAADKAKQQKQLAAAKIAKEKSEKQAAERRRLAEEKERRLAQLRKEEATKAQAAQKLASLKAKRLQAAQELAAVEVTSKPIADFDLNQDLIDNRETKSIRSALNPICKEIIDNDASVVLNTRNKQDYRWLTVRLTLCVRRIDKGFRLRHSHNEVADDSPSISLHPGRSMSLLQQGRS